MDDLNGSAPAPAPPATRCSLAARVLRPVFVGLAVVAAAVAVIVWLPLAADVKADIQDAIVGFESAGEATWPASEPITLPLTEAEQAALAADVERGLQPYASDEALAAFDPRLAVQDFTESSSGTWPQVVTGWRARVVSFDFVRQTLRGDVIVRAGVRRARQLGRMSAQKGRIVALRWLWDDVGVVREYTLRDTVDAWKVVEWSYWGVCGPNGEHPTAGGL